MSLKEELLKLADSLVEKASEAMEHGANAVLGVAMLHAAELRGMAKALPESTAISSTELRGASVGYDPLTEEAKIKARMQKQEARRQAEREERQGECIVCIIGGPAADTTVLLPAPPADGVYTAIGGQRYQFREGAFHYAPYKDQ